MAYGAISTTTGCDLHLNRGVMRRGARIKATEFGPTRTADKRPRVISSVWGARLVSVSVSVGQGSPRLRGVGLSHPGMVIGD
jgi:hypothetical protein